MNEERAREYIGLIGRNWSEIEENVTERYGMKLMHVEPLMSTVFYRNDEIVLTVVKNIVSDLDFQKR